MPSTGSPAVAEDIAQDVFMALLRHPERFDPSRGRCDRSCSGSPRWEELDDETFRPEPVNTQRREVTDVVAEAVGSLPPLQREVLI